ncbi:ATP-dependent sacrificial sulfur transferase LarE [Prochlorococcus sp. MIT 1341]|uniref:ATP-dependent sacrificial sulfur transferase LarE n=1 Tax=Prochlorococcus sp. MIT 1341 TaxID=3096221 RepID=UPI002A7478F9|nr:ATP-dependent sacrificial sulfur transferase LarE [Prochlorococcus sp. MIT 1341]
MSNFELLEELSEEEFSQLTELRNFIGGLQRVCIAYSGGVDSSLVTAIAKEQLNKNAFAVTGVSPALAPTLLSEARQQAAWIGINHKECSTKELKDPKYNSNPTNRCYACKSELHSHLKLISQKAGNFQVIDGVNYDDLKDHRPGISAAKEAGVISPLAELKIGKLSIRKISKALGFPWWDKPAEPCLASRFPYGELISSNRLILVGKAESWLKENGFTHVRVRNEGLNGKIEVPSHQIKEITEDVMRERIIKKFIELGFDSVTIDLEGFSSGKLNKHIKINSNH